MTGGLVLPLARAPIVSSIATSTLGAATVGMVAAALAWTIIDGRLGATAAGAAAFAISLPGALGLAIGGALVERFGPRRVLLTTNTAGVLGVATAAALSFAGATIAYVVAAMAVANLLSAPGNVAQDGRLREMARLARMSLERTTGIRNIGNNLAFAAGPAVGVALVGIGGLGLVLVAGALLLLAITVADAIFFPGFRPRSTGSLGTGAGLRPFRALASDKALAMVTGIGVLLIAAFASLDEVVAPSAAVDRGFGPDEVATFLALSGGGALAGGMLFAAVGERLPGRGVLVGGTLFIGFGFSVLAAVPSEIGFVLAPMLIGLGVGPLAPLVETALQRRLPMAIRAEVLGAFGAAIVLAQPFAALISGVLVDGTGADAVLWTLAGLCGVAALMAGSAHIWPLFRPRLEREGHR